MAWVETLKTPHGQYCVLSVSKHSEPSKVPTQLKQEQNVWHDYGTQDDPHSYTKLPEAIYCYISFTNSFRNLPLKKRKKKKKKFTFEPSKHTHTHTHTHTEEIHAKGIWKY